MHLHSCVANNAIHRDGHQPFKRALYQALDAKTLGALEVMRYKARKQK